ncbi:anthrax toxin-like adenylyl cyclase domain-containing protein [Anaerobaca lacustris]|uniref:Anthrax toxin-like adenylyl cyclase domain-containing protein n=1 Tax=Anaerobaca lacustris TaxID=3044600 RepID=A0AAW6U4H3_9BACT|nr:anthrax toxin-like adenylyl cyclase domain-containing protein [Sedimentisphaerales bacterium M17dextr]
MIRTRRPFVAFYVLVFSILSLRPAYPAQRAIVPDHVPPGLMKDIYLIATPRLARIPDLHGLWDPSFPLAYKTVWQDSGETIMCYGETRAQWPFEYPQYTAKGRPPDQQWHQDRMLKGYYRRGQINVTVRNSQWSSSWANDWQSRAEHHNRTYANETTTIRSMGPAPEIRTEVLPGPRTTHEFKRKSYFGNRFEAEFVVYRDTYRLEEYAAAGVAGGQHWRLQRVVSKDHVNHIRAQVRDTKSPLEILINATSGDGKPVHEALVDEIISILLEAALEASGTPIPREEAAVEERVPIAEEESKPAPPTVEPAPAVERPTATIVALSALDGNPTLHGETGADTRPSVLIRSNLVRNGTTTDGVSALVLRAEVSKDVPVVFLLQDDSLGTLEPLFESRTLSLQGKHYAFVRYVPPDSLARPGTTLPTSTVHPPKQRVGGAHGPECENLIVMAVPYAPDASGGGAQANEAGAKRVSLKLARPPVVLVHGLFSDPVHCWMGRLGEGRSLSVMLEMAGFVPFLVNYARSNGLYTEGESWLDGSARASDFASNWNVVWESPDHDETVEMETRWLRGETGGWLGLDEAPILSAWQKPANLRIGGIRAALDYYRNELNLAVTQADVVGHSMGGLLARVYASESYHPQYRRAENFGRGDIRRLVTLNTPHFGSELAELPAALESGRIGDESLAAWTRRRVAAVLFRGLFANPQAGAIRDLRPGSDALSRIGTTAVPSFAVATSVTHGQLAADRHDTGQTYLMAYSGLGMFFFYNPGLLAAAVEQRVGEWAEAGQWRRDTARDVDGTGPADRPARFDDQAGIREFLHRLQAGIDENVYHWNRYREAEFRETLRRQIDGTELVRFGLYDRSESVGSAWDDFIGAVSQMLVGGNVLKVSSTEIEPDIPHEVVDAIRSLVFNGDPENDGAVRAVSQFGGLPPTATTVFPGVLHSFSPWNLEVQREVVRLLRWEHHRFHPDGFPATAQPMPRWLPTAAFSESRLGGALAIAWAGMVPTHAQQFVAVADRQHIVILARPVNQDATPLIAAGAATKGMAIKGKSSNWGPQRGLIPVDQRFSKIWRTKRDAARDAEIAKYNDLNRKTLEEMTYPEDPEYPQLKDRAFATARDLVVTAAGRPYDVLVDPNEADAEMAVVLHADGRLYNWRTGKDEEFDPNVAPSREIEGEAAQRILANKTPMAVLADGLSDLDPKPYLTADYDLLAIGFFDPDTANAVPDDVKNAEFHELRGFISRRQMHILRMLNEAVRKNAGYTAGNVCHHGPEVQYPGSPYVDYPILVFDPGSPADGDAETFVIHQGPVGFRDIHLKRYFNEKIRDGFNLWPNPVSKGWQWEYYRDYCMDRGYDPRDAPDLKKYVAEQPRPTRGIGSMTSAPPSTTPAGALSVP